MDKKNIKKHLTSTFLSEDKKPVGLSNTEKVQADSKKFNNANQKEVAKEMKGYEKSLEKGTEPVKYENDKEQQEYHDEMQIMNGLEMNRFQNDPGKTFKERAEKAIAGDASMGNSPDYANVVTADQAGFTGPDSGKNLVKKIKSSKEKRDKASELSNKNTTSVDSTDFKDSSMNNKSPKSVAISENKINKKSKMKRLVFKKEFKGVGNALNLIPETYKVNGKQFHMTDGNEKYEIRWEGSLTEGRAIVLKASDKNLMNEDMENMKRLMGYKSQDTLGTVKGADRIDENKKFNDIWGKTKNLMTEMTGGYGFTGEGNLEGMNEYSIDEELSLNEGLMDKIKDKLTQPLTKFIEKLGDKGEELYNNLVQKFGENPSPKDIAGQIKSELKESLYEDRFGDMQVGSNPKYADSEGKQNKTDKAMSILNQVAGINMISIGFPVAILAMILGLPAFGAGWLVYALGWIISFIIMGLTTKYGRKRANQTDEGMDEYNVDEESNTNRQQQISNQRKIEKYNEEEKLNIMVNKHADDNIIYGYDKKNLDNENRKIYKVIKINPNVQSDYPIEVKFGSSHYRTHLLMISPNNIATESFLNDEYISEKSFQNIITITKDAIDMSELSETDKQKALNNVVNKFEEHINTNIPDEEKGVYEYGLSEQLNPDDDFVANSSYTVSNAGGYEVMVSDSGDAAKVRDAFGGENPETSDWLEIEYVPGEYGEMEPVIDPQGYNIPLNDITYY